ncbi:MAG: TAT-variant-translocated molybdopterin oxidoreductase [Ignavibacteriales bacterium]|nr:TAT-variant-translocated molybdopterin oxidoreductase [Ignavibacteriales bacterium]
MSSSEYNKKNFWKSLKEYYDDPAVFEEKAHEFQEGVTDDFNPSQLSGLSRRKFLAALTASAAFAATACSDYRDKGEIIPYNQRPEEVLPGKANLYASTCTSCAQSCGVLVKTREGRPIKIDGNPDHPINQGKICSKGQASILNLYDPERLTEPTASKNTVSWSSVDSDIVSSLNSAQSNGKQIAILAGNIVSPTTKKVLDDFKAKYTNTKVYSYNLFGDDSRRAAWFESYGSAEYPSIKWEEANVILAVDADFLGNEGSFIENTRRFANRREVVENLDINRLYVAEGRMSATGMMSDYRIRISPSNQLEFVSALTSEIAKSGSTISLDATAKSLLEQSSLTKFAGGQSKKLTHLVQDLIANKGKSIVYAGDTLPKEVHIAVNLLNEVLGNTVLYDYSKVSKSLLPSSTSDEIQALVTAMKSGSVETVIHFDCNPVFDFPKSFEYAKAIKNVKTVVTLTEAENETSSASNYSLPINHALESWGDAYTKSGVYSLQQPVISPIFNSRQKEAILLTWIAGNTSAYNDKIYHQYLLDNFNATIYTKKNSLADQKTFWYSALHDGVVTFDETSASKSFAQSALSGIKLPSQVTGNTLHLTESYFIGNGKFANNGWLQETPHPVSKISWDNYASISPAFAKQLGLEMNDLVEISVNGKQLTIPVLVQPGVHDTTINIELGYGRKVVGDVGKDVGFDANVFVSAFGTLVYQNVSVKKVGGTHKLVSTQEHHSLDDTFVKDFHRIRKIIQEGTVEKYKKEPNFLHEEVKEELSITREHEYTGTKWAMAIDLNKCTSCGTCVTACNVENNVPVVGKDQVGRGREMQWMRIDCYYSGTPEDPIASNQPMLCQHCDNAPCENVCPVNATNHSQDGLNQMAYNRCVGTRYCSNNCPYKVRRYNFYNFRDHFADAYYENNLTAMVHNPEVTVRSRGVMEKCTFCVQRIMEARSDAIKDGRVLKGTDVVTACQQACPANAIVFGDANDKESQIAKLRNHNLAYHVLEELNVKPNVTYIAKLRNTHSEEVI